MPDLARSKLALVLVLVLESKAPYYCEQFYEYSYHQKNNSCTLCVPMLLFCDTAISHSNIYIRIVIENIAVHRCTAAALGIAHTFSMLGDRVLCPTWVSRLLHLQYIRVIPSNH